MNRIKKEEVFVVSDDSDVEDMDTEGPLLFEQVKSIVDKELIVYTTRLDQMLVPFQGHDVSLERIEKASKPILKEKKDVVVKLDHLHTVESEHLPCDQPRLEQLPIPVQDSMNVDCTTNPTKAAQITETMYISLGDHNIKEELMPITFGDHHMKVENIEKSNINNVENNYDGAMKLKLLELFQSVENEHNSCVQKCSEAERNRSENSATETIHITQQRGLCKPMSVTLTDYRKYPVLSTKELDCWNTFCRAHPHSGKEAKLDHVVKMVHVRSGLTEIFHMSDLGIILKVENGPAGCLPFSDLEISVCCWYSKTKYLRELYLQLEKSDDFTGLSRYLPHYIRLCGNHECPPNKCSCCESCKKRVWYQKTDCSKLPLSQKVQENSRGQKRPTDTKQQNIAGKYLVAKALAYKPNTFIRHYANKSKNQHKQSITVQNFAKQGQLKETVNNVLLEIRYVVYDNAKIQIVNKMKILDLGPNGQIQSYVEKVRPDFIISGLVDESKKRITHNVCCWKKLQTVIHFLQADNYLPEVYQFIREKHTCPINKCHCCCQWKSVWSQTNHVFSTEPKSTSVLTEPSTKPVISVKPLKSLTVKRKPARRRIKKSMVIKPKSTNDQCATISAAQPPMGNENSENMLNIKNIYVPAGTPVNGYGVNSQLMQSIIDEEITRLLETNSMIPINMINEQSTTRSIHDLPESIVIPDNLSNSIETNREVPEVTEVNDCIKTIIDKFRDIRFTLNKDGRVTAIISDPPQSADDVTLLKNLLEKIQALLDMQAEKSDETLSNILGLQHQINAVAVFPIPAQYEYLEINNSTQQCLNRTDETPDTLTNLLTRAPIPPNFPAAPVHTNLENSFVYLYKESDGEQKEEQMITQDENCLGNIKIAKVESIGKKVNETVSLDKTRVQSMDTKISETETREKVNAVSIQRKGIETGPRLKSYESLRHRARLQLNRLQNKAKKVPLGAPSVPPLISISTPTTPFVNAVQPLLNNTKTPTTSGPAEASTLSSSSRSSDQVPPLSMFSSRIPSSAFVTSVPSQCPSGITSIPLTALTSSYFIPVDMPTVKVLQNIDANTNKKVVHTIVIPDEGDETILGD